MKEFFGYDKNVAIGGINIILIAFLVLVILKMCGAVTWSWILITLPIWGPPTLFFSILLTILGVVELTYSLIWLGNKIFKHQ